MTSSSTTNAPSHRLFTTKTIHVDNMATITSSIPIVTAKRTTAETVTAKTVDKFIPETPDSIEPNNADVFELVMHNGFVKPPKVKTPYIVDEILELANSDEDTKRRNLWYL